MSHPLNLGNLLSALIKRLHNSDSSQNGHSDSEYRKALRTDDKVREELAYAVLLVELGLADDDLDIREHAAIQMALTEIFGCSPQTGDQLIAQALALLNSFRTNESFISRIKEQYSAEERKKLFEVIDRVIAADGKKDEQEQRLRNKLNSIL